MTPKTKSKLTGKRCMCPTCKEVFSAVSNFDKHRKAGVCADPASVGLRIAERGDNSWWVSAAQFTHPAQQVR